GEGDLNGACAPEFDGKPAVGLDLGYEIAVPGEAVEGEIERWRASVEFAAGREHAGRRGAGFGADCAGVKEQDAEMIAGEPPGDGSADDAAAGDDDVELVRHF